MYTVQCTIEHVVLNAASDLPSHTNQIVAKTIFVRFLLRLIRLENSLCFDISRSEDGISQYLVSVTHT